MLVNSIGRTPSSGYVRCGDIKSLLSDGIDMQPSSATAKTEVARKICNYQLKWKGNEDAASGKTVITNYISLIQSE